MNNANPEQRNQNNNGPVSTAALSEAVHQMQGTQNAANVNNMTILAASEAAPNPLDDKEKELLLQETIRYIIPQVGLVNGVRYIAMKLCDNEQSKMQIAEHFALLTPNVQPSPFVLEVIKLAVNKVPEARDAFELFDVWSNIDKLNTARTEALQRYHNYQQQNTAIFFGQMGYLNQ